MCLAVDQPGASVGLGFIRRLVGQRVLFFMALVPQRREERREPRPSAGQEPTAGPICDLLLIASSFFSFLGLAINEEITRLV